MGRTSKAGTNKQRKSSSTAESTQVASQGPSREASEGSPKPGSVDAPRSAGGSAAEGAAASAEGSAAICSDPLSVAVKVADLAQYMPVLARTSVPCADVVFAKHRTDSELQPVRHSAAIAEHLTVYTGAPQQAAHTTGSLDSDFVRRIWGMPVANLDATTPDTQKDSRSKEATHAFSTDAKCLASMPARRVTRDFMAVQRFATQLPTHSSGGVADTAAAFVYRAVWARIRVLPSAGPARVWEQTLTQPASLLARVLSASSRWEAARSLQALDSAQKALEKRHAQSRALGSVQASLPSASDLRQDEAASAPDSGQVSSQNAVWQALSGFTTDAGGCRAVRQAWASTTGLAKLSKRAVRSSSRQKNAAAMIDLQLAVQDMGDTKVAEGPRWADHRTLRAALYAAESRYNSIKNLPPALQGPLGPLATPRWLASAVASKSNAAGKVSHAVGPSYDLPALPSAAQTPEWLHARISHAWVDLAVKIGDHSALSRAGGAAAGTSHLGSSGKLASVWNDLLPPQSLGEGTDSFTSSQSEQSLPGPLRRYEFEEEVLFALDSLASGEPARLPCLLYTSPSPRD